ncbi:MAG: DUF308 domain-containing protein [Candidatus ainarchaeum sp.]|nr:DUF308 domain-containing protein [Candidatus ainarchaeum sp.]
MELIENSALQKLRGFFSGIGLLFIVLGLLLILFPVFGTFAIEILLGAVLLIMGLVQILFSFISRQWKGFAIFLLNGLLCTAVGALLLAYPIAGVVALTLLIGWLMFFQGIFEMAKALQLRPWKFWSLIFFDGIFCFFLGVLVVAGWPSDSGWAIGLLLGISLLSIGFASILIGQALKKQAK